MNKQQEELAMRLDLLIPMKWISDNFPNVEHIFSKMVELNQEWVEEVVNNGNHRLTDVLHDFIGIYGNFACPPEEKDEHFVPRISTDFVDSIDSIIKMIKDTNIDGEHMQYILEQVGMDYQMYKQLNVEYNKDFVPRISTDFDAVDVKVNGYTNIQTYRLCLVLDNEGEIIPNPMQRFFELCSEDEFETTDINLINWNEVIERYSSTNWKHIVHNIRLA